MARNFNHHWAYSDGREWMIHESRDRYDFPDTKHESLYTGKGKAGEEKAEKIVDERNGAIRDARNGITPTT